MYLPPWNVPHFRRFSTKSEFYPFGRPLFINCIAPFRQLQASKNLMALARAAKFPKEHFERFRDAVQSTKQIENIKSVGMAISKMSDIVNDYFKKKGEKK